MKKIFIVYGITLILGLLTSNAIMNTLLYNKMVLNFFNIEATWLKILYLILIALISGLVSFSFLKVMQVLIQKNIQSAEYENEESSKKRKAITIRIN